MPCRVICLGEYRSQRRIRTLQLAFLRLQHLGQCEECQEAIAAGDVARCDVASDAVWHVACSGVVPRLSGGHQRG